MMLSGKSRRISARIALSVLLALTLVLFTYITRDTTFTKLALVHLNQVDIEVEIRTKLWGGHETPAEAACRQPYSLAVNQSPIPNVVHFIYLAQEGMRTELSFMTFLAIKTALLRMQATEVKLHTFGLNAANTWWQEIQHHVTHVVHNRSEVRTPRDAPLDSFSLPHQSDFLRLEVLRQEGGIYLDTDVYVLKPFAELLRNPHDAVLGHEGGNRYGLCNAVILSRPHSEFVERWQTTYATFNERKWNTHSVLIPKRLSVQYPELVCPLSPKVFFWPLWAKTHRTYMHTLLSKEERHEFRDAIAQNNGSMYPEQLAYHAWHSLDAITPSNLMYDDTRFNLLLREVYMTPL